MPPEEEKTVFKGPPDAAARQQLLVDNPQPLFGF
jgi:hypothetical protein